MVDAWIQYERLNCKDFSKAEIDLSSSWKPPFSEVRGAGAPRLFEDGSKKNNNWLKALLCFNHLDTTD